MRLPLLSLTAAAALTAGALYATAADAQVWYAPPPPPPPVYAPPPPYYDPAIANYQRREARRELRQMRREARREARAAERYAYESSAYAPAYTGEVVTRTVTNGPVPDTPRNRAYYGGPDSRGGQLTAPVGN